MCIAHARPLGARARRGSVCRPAVPPVLDACARTPPAPGYPAGKAAAPRPLRAEVAAEPRSAGDAGRRGPGAGGPASRAVWFRGRGVAGGRANGCPAGGLCVRERVAGAPSQGWGGGSGSADGVAYAVGVPPAAGGGVHGDGGGDGLDEGAAGTGGHLLPPVSHGPGQGCPARPGEPDGHLHSGERGQSGARRLASRPFEAPPADHQHDA
jgi:hypothetical protein